ncbi:MAG: DUF2634 domain-containing protein [Raoultibacter sp.]
MIPTENALLKKEFEVVIYRSKTYRMYFDEKRIRGTVDGLDAIRQTINHILSTERYEYPAYSDNYGFEFGDLFGKPASFALPELKRRIVEALTWDSRIDGVDNFTFEIRKIGKVHVTFTAHTIHGDIEEEREMNI